ncbi:MAG: hypothetical protein MZV64_18890 [Ignavibacteriales bacterium]|nr:hypothetical protein [Ignavibacteriales bacterium]
MAHEATSFPQAIGLASAWDAELHERVLQTVARDAGAQGALCTFAGVGPGARPALGTHRGNLWRRPVPGLEVGGGGGAARIAG